MFYTLRNLASFLVVGPLRPPPPLTFFPLPLQMFMDTFLILTLKVRAFWQKPAGEGGLLSLVVNRHRLPGRHFFLLWFQIFFLYLLPWLPCQLFAPNIYEKLKYLVKCWFFVHPRNIRQPPGSPFFYSKPMQKASFIYFRKIQNLQDRLLCRSYEI